MLLALVLIQINLAVFWQRDELLVGSFLLQNVFKPPIGSLTYTVNLFFLFDFHLFTTFTLFFDSNAWGLGYIKITSAV